MWIYSRPLIEQEKRELEAALRRAKDSSEAQELTCGAFTRFKSQFLSHFGYVSTWIIIPMLLSQCTSHPPSGKEPADAKAYGKMLMNNLSGVFSLDFENKELLGKYEVPPIKNGNWIIRSHPMALVDSFAEETGTIATIFVKVEDEFVRISTTEKDKEPGDPLDHDSPAYHRLLGELRYTGVVSLAGGEYMVDYDVFRDRNGRVIGAYLVGIPLRDYTIKRQQRMAHQIAEPPMIR